MRKSRIARNILTSSSLGSRQGAPHPQTASEPSARKVLGQEAATDFYKGYFIARSASLHRPSKENVRRTLHTFVPAHRRGPTSEQAHTAKHPARWHGHRSLMLARRSVSCWALAHQRATMGAKPRAPPRLSLRKKEKLCSWDRRACALASPRVSSPSASRATFSQHVTDIGPDRPIASPAQK